MSKFACYDSDRPVRSVVSDPTGEVLTCGALVDWLNDLSAEAVEQRQRANRYRGLLAELVAALDGLEYARRFDPDIAHPLAEERLAAALAAAKRGLEP